MRKLTMLFFAVAIIFAFGGCVYEFVPDPGELEMEDMKVVVIEGDIVAGGITYVRVGYSLPLQAGLWGSGLDAGTESFYDPSTGSYNSWKASVWVESADGEILGGETYELGEYTIDTRDLDIDGMYRLCVSIPSRGEYVSEFKKVLVAPQIEKLSYSVPQDSSCVHIEVSAKGKGGETGYYRWEYEEAWDASPEITPQIGFDPNIRLMVYLSDTQKEKLSSCFSVERTSDILVASTEKLRDNVITDNRISTISATNRKIAKDYCITVYQTCLDEEGYAYWESMKKNTSGTGGLFAPQPSEVRGNITSLLNPDENVIGYVNVVTKTSKRLFIPEMELGIYDRMSCINEMTYFNSISWPNAYSKYGMRPVSYLKNEAGGDIMDQAHWAPKACVEALNCTAKPDYWPEK